MKQRAIKRCIKRAQKQARRGTYNGRKEKISPYMTGAMFVFGDIKSVLRPDGYDCQWSGISHSSGLKFYSGHAHWYDYECTAVVAISYV